MTMTFAEARDEILTVFKTSWDTTGHIALYDDLPDTAPTTSVSWARALVQHTGGGQATLAGDSATRCYSRLGLVTIQIFTPSAEGLSAADTLAKIVADAFEGTATPGGAWFRNVRVNEAGASGHWFQTNVIAEFEYTEVK